MAGTAKLRAVNGTRPSLRFYHSEALHHRMVVLIEAIESDPRPKQHRAELAELVVELTQSGFDYFFMKLIRDAGMGFMVEQSTRVGLASILRLLTPISRRIIGGMDVGQLLSVTRHMRELMD